MSKNVLITAGPTREYLDTVRFLTNASSGIQAVAISRELLKNRFSVRIVTGPVNIKYPDECVLIRVSSTFQMYEKVKENAVWADVMIFAASPCDWTVCPATTKIKKKKTMDLKLTSTVDIAAKTAGLSADTVTAGFALEDTMDMDEALRKKSAKHFDIMVLNMRSSIALPVTSGYLINGGHVVNFNAVSKRSLAHLLCAEIKRHVRRRRHTVKGNEPS